MRFHLRRGSVLGLRNGKSVWHAAMAIVAVVIVLAGIGALPLKPSSQDRADAAAISKTAYPDNGAYSTDGDPDALQSDWMKTVDPSRYLNQMSIPGTHDSDTFYSDYPLAQAQSMTIPGQLNAGIRALDIRVGERASGTCSGQVYMFHGDFTGGKCLEALNVLMPELTDFLNAHPTEFLVMRFGDSGTENYDGSNLPGNSCDDISNGFSTTGRPYTDYFYNGGLENPQVSQLQGKIFLINDFGIGSDPQNDGGTTGNGGTCSFSSFASPALKFYYANPDPNAIILQDQETSTVNDFAPLTDFTREDKWEVIRDQFNKTTGPQTAATTNSLYINEINAAPGGGNTPQNPCEFASGTINCANTSGYQRTGWTYGYTAFGNDGTCKLADDNCQSMLDSGLYQLKDCAGFAEDDTQTCSVTFVGLNMMAEAYIAGSQFAGPNNDELSNGLRPGFAGVTSRTGIVYADYPGGNLIQSIIAVNFAPKPSITVTGTKADGTPYTLGSWSNQAVTLHYTCENLTPAETCPTDNIENGIAVAPWSSFTEAWIVPAIIPDPDNLFNASVFTRVNIDESVPIASPALTHADGTTYTPGTWTNQDVYVAWNWTDVTNNSFAACSAPGAKPCTEDYGTNAIWNQNIGPAGTSGIDPNHCTTTSVMSGEGLGSFTNACSTVAGNQGLDSVSNLMIDKTPPAVSYTGNAGTYTADQNVAITCAAADSLSGVANTTCSNITGPAYSFGVGTHTFSASATDNAGNTGNGSTTFTVNPAAVPGAPSAVTATPGNGQATVSWTPPASDGGSPVIGYVVTPYIGFAPQKSRIYISTATTQTMTGLAPNTTYRFKVAAINAVGVSAASRPSNAITTPNVPEPPTIGTAVAASGQASISWTAPTADGGSPVTGYIVTPYVGYWTGTPRQFNSTDTTETVTGLTNGWIYRFRVQAVNAVGTSTYSKVTTPITPHA